MKRPPARHLSVDIPLSGMFDGLNVFAVGGVVRAQFTGNPVSDEDLMVTGVRPSEMINRGFKLIIGGTTPESMTNEEFREFAIEAAEAERLPEALEQVEGTVFPVFLDDHGREVALARMERSTGEGNHDFVVEANPEVTVEEDLVRRDLTCNAMAIALTESERFEAGELIDPFGGRDAIEQEQIEMVRPESFREDPLRILRMARFAARLGFSVDDDTLDAARENRLGIHNLPAERWGLELVKAMKQAQAPSRFFRVLDEINALEVVLPELAALQEVPAGPEEFHGEGSAFEHTMLVLDEMANLRPGDERGLFAALAHDLGKGVGPKDTHHKHHIRGVELMEPIRERLVLSDELCGVMESASRQHMKMHDIQDLNAPTVLELVETLRDDYEVSNPGDEAVVTHITLEELIDLAIADSRGRIPSKDFDAEAARERFNRAFAVLDTIGGAHVMETFDSPEGEHFGELLHQERVRAFKNPSEFGITL